MYPLVGEGGQGHLSIKYIIIILLYNGKQFRHTLELNDAHTKHMS